MNENLLKAAQDGLRVQDIALRRSHIELADGFEPKYEGMPDDIEMMQRTKRSELMALKQGDDEGEVFRVFVDMGIRWVRDPKLGKSLEQGKRAKLENAMVVASIEATFVAEYQIIVDIEQEALNEFALHNAPWHIWPYWREYVANQCARLNILKATMPMQCLAPLPSTQEDTTDS